MSASVKLTCRLFNRKNWLTTKGSPHSRIDKCEFNNERVIEKAEFTSFTITRG